MLVKDYPAAIDAFKKASALKKNPEIELDLIEALAAGKQQDEAMLRLKTIAPLHPMRTIELINRDSSGLRMLKKHPDFESWLQRQQE